VHILFQFFKFRPKSIVYCKSLNSKQKYVFTIKLKFVFNNLVLYKFKINVPTWLRTLCMYSSVFYKIIILYKKNNLYNDVTEITNNLIQDTILKKYNTFIYVDFFLILKNSNYSIGIMLLLIL